MIGALLGALATVASGAIGAGASRDAAEQNYNMDLLNYYARERERTDSINQSRRNEADTKLGQTDAAGNRVHFVEGQGWVTDLADGQKKLQELYQREELGQLENDLPKKRGVLNDNIERQRGEGSTAQSLMDAFKRVQRQDPREVENQLNNASTKGITQGFDSALQDAMQSSIRTGASNSGKVAASIGKERATALENAFMQNKINSKGQADDQYTREQGNIANLYNMFASRATAMPDVAYNPRNIEGMTAQASAGSAGNQQGAMSALINAFAKQGGSMSKIDPDYGLANAVGSGGQALGAAFDSIGADRQRALAIDSYGQYSGVDPKLYRTSTGAW